jgi:hypothetical protein
LTIVSGLVCDECGRRPRRAENAPDEWRVYFDYEEEPVVFCPDCAEAESPAGKLIVWELWAQDECGAAVLIAASPNLGKLLAARTRLEPCVREQVYWITPR